MSIDDELTPIEEDKNPYPAQPAPEEEQTAPEEDNKRPQLGRGGYVAADPHDVESLGGMYRSWYLDYASYVILERAVPHIDDGLKPVQRRILHAMQTLDDGRFNKVANIVGTAMQYHPHGDASIGDAIVQLGQKELLVDTQGNWGNILTGDSAAAPRYIEARLSPFALETLFSPKITEWTMSYDGRKREPVTLPAKFPLLLTQGVEGIAVGLSSKILPHNFVEVCNAAISHLKGEPFALLPDFQTGGLLDATRYNDGARGGAVKVRARIEKLDSKTLAITEIPFGKTTATLIASIQAATEKGKIKIRHVDDNTSATARIIVQLQPGTSSDKAIDALYAFTDCEVSISPNCCVIDGQKPRFLTVSDVLRYNVDRTKELLRRELEIRRAELLETLHYASLEKIFIEERIYKDKGFENATDMDAACAHIDERLTPFYPQFLREVTKDDILRLMEIKMARILRFNKDKADELIARTKAEIEKIDADLRNMVEVTSNWYHIIKEKYGKEHTRRTEIRSFDTIEATKVVEANEKLYINRIDGFIGTGLKHDEFVDNCSDIDDVILFYRDGTYKITRIAEKVFVGETERSVKEKRKAEIIHIAVFKKNDRRTTYNAVYRDGKTGNYFYKRFNVTSVTHDREYDLTQGKAGSRVSYFTANANGEAEVIKIALKPNPKLKKLVFERDFGELMIKGRQSRGNLLTKNDIYRITLKSHGASTLGGCKVWFDRDIGRLNIDGRGNYLGEFQGGDRILVVLADGNFYTTDFDLNNHYEPNVFKIVKFNESAVWTAVLFDADQGGKLYLKRFNFERVTKPQNYLGENPATRLVALVSEPEPRFRVVFGGADAFRGEMIVEAEQFVGVKSFKARGKRVTVFEVDTVELLPSPEPPAGESDEAGDGQQDVSEPEAPVNENEPTLF